MGLRKPKKTADTEEVVASEEVPTEVTDEEDGHGNAPEISEDQALEAEEGLAAEGVGEPEHSDSKAVAAAPVTGAMANVEGGKFEDRMAEDGFEGLQTGFYSYKTVKLDTDGTFETSEGETLGKSIMVQLLGSKPKWAYSDKNDDDADAEFSYDQKTNAKGEELQPILDEWEAEGIEIEVKRYLDVTAQVVGCAENEEMVGEIVILSISPSAVAKFTGHMGKLSYLGHSPRDVVTECYVGAKVTRTKNSFYPWAFRVARPEDAA